MDGTNLTTAAALRFRVVVGELEVGRFSRCRGLGFAYDFTEYPEGGERAFTHTLRGPVRHATLTLERGVTHETALLDWFFASHDERERRPITVFLLDDGGRPLRHWAFDRALPLRWDGPEFDAGTTAAAVETLEIAHEGLVSTSDAASGPRVTAGWSFQRARLEIEGGVEVTCWLNPFEYTVSQSNRWSHGALPDMRLDSVGPQELTVKLMFDAADDPERSVQDVCSALFAALDPVVEDEAAGGAGRPPRLTFAWGESPPFHAVARCLSVRYLQFRPDGAPTRAEVDLTLVRTEAPATPGQARRAGLVADAQATRAVRGGGTHVVTDGDSLPSIAFRSYGEADAWRRIAERNGIDDPTRLERGARLEVPVLTSPPVKETPAAPSVSREGIGAGVAFPLQVDRTGGVALTRGAADVSKAIVLILTTAPGERPMSPSFGCGLDAFLFNRIDASTLGRVQQEVMRALGRWEPRIEVLDAKCDVSNSASGLLTLDIAYVLSGRTGVHRHVHEFSVLEDEESS